LVGSPPEQGHDPNWVRYKWGRADDVLGRGQYGVFFDIKPTDVIQGELGDCYFLSALSSLAEKPGLIRRLFNTEKPNEFGVYSIWMNIDGLWTETIVDDYFPIKDEGRGAVQFAFSRTSEDELWVLLLEKAYAKNYGNYFTIEGGDPVYALRDLTGAPFDRITDLKSGNRNEYW
jgi:calpain-15